MRPLLQTIAIGLVSYGEAYSCGGAGLGECGGHGVIYGVTGSSTGSRGHLWGRGVMGLCVGLVSYGEAYGCGGAGLGEGVGGVMGSPLGSWGHLWGHGVIYGVMGSPLGSRGHLWAYGVICGVMGSAVGSWGGELVSYGEAYSCGAGGAG